MCYQPTVFFVCPSISIWIVDHAKDFPFFSYFLRFFLVCLPLAAYVYNVHVRCSNQKLIMFSFFFSFFFHYRYRHFPLRRNWKKNILILRVCSSCSAVCTGGSIKISSKWINDFPQRVRSFSAWIYIIIIFFLVFGLRVYCKFDAQHFGLITSLLFVQWFQSSQWTRETERAKNIHK